MDELSLISDRDQDKLTKLISERVQATVISAPGQSEIDLALQFLKLQIKRLEVFEIKPDDSGVIKVEVIRDLLARTVISPNKMRYFLVMNAEKMGLAAQNALLKSLEEPNAKNFFILLTHSQSAILPTVMSRSQHLKLRPLSVTKMRNYLKAKYPNFDPKQFVQTEFIASDDFELWKQLIIQPDLLKSYLEIAHIARLIVTQRQLIERLIEIRKIGKDREKALKMTKLVTKIYSNLIVKRNDATHINNLEHWLKAQDRLVNYGSVQLVLTEAVL